MSDMQVVSGTRRAIKEMSDGTIRVQIDIDPRFRSMFWSLFPNIDMPVALAPLVADFEQRGDDELPVRQPEPEKPKGGALAKLAGAWCDLPDFWEFLTQQFKITSPCQSEKTAAEIVREICDIGSRADLDHDPVAKRSFDERIRRPFAEWQRKRGAA